MQASTVDRVTFSPPDMALPLHLHLTPSTVTTLKYALLAAPSLAAGVITLGLISGLALFEPAAFAIFIDRPLSLLPLATGAALIAMFLGYPATQIVRRLGSRTDIEIDGVSVSVRQTGLFGNRNHTTPLASYRGLARRTRTAVSGTLHEILLVPVTGTSMLLIAFDTDTGPSLLDRLAESLALPILDLSTALPNQPLDPGNAQMPVVTPLPKAA